MQQLLKFLCIKNKFFCGILFFNILQQVIVALTIPAIASLVHVVDKHDPYLFYLLITLMLFILPYIPYAFIKVLLSYWQFDIIRSQIKSYYFNFRNRVEHLASIEAKEKILSVVSFELFSVAKESTLYVQQILGTILNIFFSIIAISIFVDPNYLYGYFLSAVLVTLIFLYTNKNIERTSAAALNERLKLNSLLTKSWESVLAGSDRIFLKFNKSSDLAFLESRQSTLKREKFINITSAIAIVFAILPIAITTLLLFIFNPENYTFYAVLIATFPRQIQIIIHLSGLIEDLLTFPKFKAEIQNVTDIINLKVENKLHKYIQYSQITVRNGSLSVPSQSFLKEMLSSSISNGRYVIEGQNGAGKSTYLKQIATYLDNKFYLSAEKNFFLDDSKHFSSGEKTIHFLDLAFEDKNLSAFLLDEWDANLDSKNYEKYDKFIENLSKDRLVIEIKHHK
jgi:hypothetical protein